LLDYGQGSGSAKRDEAQSTATMLVDDNGQEWVHRTQSDERVQGYTEEDGGGI